MNMENIKNIIVASLCLWLQFINEFKRIHKVIFYCEVKNMITVIFQAIESAIRAVSYLLILIIGLSAAALGAYASIFFAIRIGQFLHAIFFRSPWI